MRWLGLKKCLVFLILVAGPQIYMPGDVQAAAERRLSIHELTRLYGNKSWFWKDGIAYFERSGRFVAYSGPDSKRNTVKGGWGAYKNGKVCFSGTWRSKSGDGFDSSCFEHKTVNGDIYQRKMPEGDWYIFKHAKTRKNDEYRKVVSGNYTKLSTRK